MNTDADNYGLVALLVASDNLHRHDKVAVSKGVEGHTTVGMLRHRKPRNRRCISKLGFTCRLGEGVFVRNEALLAFWASA
jgi:hypothetical protein